MLWISLDKWKMFHGPAQIAINTMLRYRVPKGGKNIPLTNIDAIAIDDVSLTIQRKGWNVNWCEGTNKTYYLGLEWMQASACDTNIEIKGDRIKGGPRWFEAPEEFVKMGIQGVKQAANADLKFVTKDMWTGLINVLVNTGWYVLYGGLIILGLTLFIVVKCLCTAMGKRMCSKKTEKGDELTVLEKLIDFQVKGHRRFKKRRGCISENPLL